MDSINMTNELSELEMAVIFNTTDDPLEILEVIPQEVLPFDFAGVLASLSNSDSEDWVFSSKLEEGDNTNYYYINQYTEEEAYVSYHKDYLLIEINDEIIFRQKMTYNNKIYQKYASY